MTISYVYRGGSWGISSDLCRAAYRYGDPPDFRLNRLGFRVLRSSEEEVKYRVARGGSWGSNSDYCRSANRWNSPVIRYYILGFRVIKENKHDD
jgi:formylglycine-generating enzyme required for sulfatase activity